MAPALFVGTFLHARTAGAQATDAVPQRIPARAVLGTLNIGAFPQASLDGKALTLAPGFRLFDREGRIVVPSSVAGRNQLVAYVTGPVGEVITAWVPTPAELDAIRRRSSRGR